MPNDPFNIHNPPGREHVGFDEGVYTGSLNEHVGPPPVMKFTNLIRMKHQLGDFVRESTPEFEDPAPQRKAYWAAGIALILGVVFVLIAKKNNWF